LRKIKTLSEFSFDDALIKSQFFLEVIVNLGEEKEKVLKVPLKIFEARKQVEVQNWLPPFLSELI